MKSVITLFILLFITSYKTTINSNSDQKTFTSLETTETLRISINTSDLPIVRNNEKGNKNSSQAFISLSSKKTENNHSVSGNVNETEQIFGDFGAY